VPRISFFFGIEILMHWNDHAPPHFHARYQGDSAQVLIASGTILNGFLPPRVRRLVKTWARLYRRELMRAWASARLGAVPESIPPLE